MLKNINTKEENRKIMRLLGISEEKAKDMFVLTKAFKNQNRIEQVRLCSKYDLPQGRTYGCWKHANSFGDFLAKVFGKGHFVVLEEIGENEETPDTTNPYVVYDGQYGYYDVEQYFVKNFNRAKEEIKKYVEDGANSTYGIISEVTGNFDDIISAEDTPNLGQYNPNAVIYSLRKENNKIIENFIKKEGE